MPVKPITYRFPQTSRTETPNAPAYDNRRKVKSWVDPNPGVGPNVTYQMLTPDGKVEDVNMSVIEASSLNLPGHPAYAPYTPLPSRATFNGGTPIPFGVVSQADAIALATALGLDQNALFDEMAGFGSLVSYPADDPRRPFGIKFANGSSEEVARMLAQRNANGVDSPGEWKQDAGGNWSWQSELPSDTPTTEVMTVPIVPPGPGESIEVTPFGPMIVTNDAPAATGGTFNAATDPTILEIRDGIRALRALLHV